MGEFYQASKADISGITNVMVNSFATYPFVAHCLKDVFKGEAKRLQFLEKMCGVLAKALMRKSVCLIKKHDDEVAAFCILSRIDDMEIRIWDLVASGAIGVLPYLFKKGVLQFIIFYLKHAANVNFKKDDKTWYIHLFAVSPHHQGRQLGSKLMNDCVIPYVKQQQGKGIAVSTNTKPAAKFYTKTGYKIISRSQIFYKRKAFGKWDLFCAME